MLTSSTHPSASPKATEFSIAYHSYPISSLDKVARVLKSPVFLTLILIAGTLTAGLHPYIIEPNLRLATTAILGLATLTYVFYNIKKIAYTFSVTSALIKQAYHPQKYPWWNKINDYIYLGAIPLESERHPQKLTALGIKHFVSLVEPFEFEPSLTASPIAYIDSHNVLKLPSPDYQGVLMRTIEQGVNYIQQKVEKEEAVYVHCKAGKGRSAIIVACHQYKYRKNKNLKKEDVLTQLKQQRPLINMNTKQMAAYNQYCALVDQKDQRPQ